LRTTVVCWVEGCVSAKVASGSIASTISSDGSSRVSSAGSIASTSSADVSTSASLDHCVFSLGFGL
jgi:hypothetical protein